MTKPPPGAALEPDAIDAAAGIGADDGLFALRRERPEFVDGAEECRRSVLAPADDGGLEAPVRSAVACRMAAQNDDPVLVSRYRAAIGADDATGAEISIADGMDAEALRAPYDAIARHADLITGTPREATADDITRLAAAGLSNQQIVALSELIGFVNFETRIAFGLRLIKDAAGERGPGGRPDGDGDATEPPPGQPSVQLKSLRWIPYIEPVDVDKATPEQLAAMKVTPSSGKVSPYVLTLAHDPDSYLKRTELFNTIMYVKGGLRSQDRELGALGASMQNGCNFCAVVHAQRQAKHAGSSGTVYALMSGQEERLSPRDAAIADFARALSRTPPAATVAQVAALHEHGLNDFEIIDLIHSIAIFGWANRLMHVLGYSVPETD